MIRTGGVAYELLRPLDLYLLWTISGEGIAQLTFAAVFVCSGMIVPLPLFPDWAQPIIKLLPFRGLCDVPFRIYAGHIPSSQYLGELALQSAWIVGLIIVGRWVLSRGMRRLIVQGG